MGARKFDIERGDSKKCDVFRGVGSGRVHLPDIAGADLRELERVPVPSRPATEARFGRAMAL